MILRGRLVQPMSGAILAEGRVAISDDRRRGAIEGLVRDFMTVAPLDSLLLEIDGGPRLNVRFVSSGWPDIPGDAYALEGGSFTAFTVTDEGE